MAFNNLRKLAVFALSAAMIVSLGACGTSEKSDSTASGDSKSSSNVTGYDVSGVTKDDDIAAMLPESVTKDGKLIPGLYAAGELVGGVMGDDSPSGANNGWALTAGKLAAFYDSPAGFRHGPKSLVDNETLVVVMVSSSPW